MAAASVQRIATALGTLALAGSALGLALADSGWGPWWCDWFQHPRWQYLAGALGGGLALLIAGRRRWALAAPVLAAWALWPLWPLLAVEHRPAPGAPALALLSANVHSGNPDPEDCVRILAAQDAAVVAVIEITPGWLPALAPLRAAYPVFRELPREDNFGIALYARGGTIATWWPAELPAPSLELTLPDGVRLLATHPLPPLRAAELGWHHAQLAAIAAWARAAGPRCAVIGDLNCTPWSRQFRALCHDGGLRPCGVRATIPTWLRAAWPLTLPLDHLLVGDGLALSAHQTGPEVGSDHLPVQGLLSAQAR